KDEPFRPKIPAALRGVENYFDLIRERDLLLHHPYESFAVVTDFIARAARDPDVAAIKICLYRTGQNSPIPEWLIEASARGADATDLFNFLTGFSRQKDYRQLVVAPSNLREKTLALISREAEHARAGRTARIVVKVNRIADTQIVAALYEASRAGVEIDLIVR